MIHPENVAPIDAAEEAADIAEANWLNRQASMSLAEALAADGPAIGDTPEAQQAWRIDGDNTATWALRKLAEQNTEIDRIRRQAQTEIDRVQAWATSAETGPAQAAAFFTAKLIDYRRRLEDANPKLPKTYKLPAGSIAVRAGRQRVTVTDADAFTVWAATYCPAALAPPKPLVSALTDYVAADGVLVDAGTGEVVPGVEVVTGEPTYTAKPNVDVDPF